MRFIFPSFQRLKHKIPPLFTVFYWFIFSAFLSSIYLAFLIHADKIPNLSAQFESSQREINGWEYLIERLCIITRNSSINARVLWLSWRQIFQKIISVVIVLAYSADLGPRELVSFACRIGLGNLFINSRNSSVSVCSILNFADLPGLERRPGSCDDGYDPYNPEENPYFFHPVVGMVPREVYNRWRINEEERFERTYFAKNNLRNRILPPIRRLQGWFRTEWCALANWFESENRNSHQESASNQDFVICFDKDGQRFPPQAVYCERTILKSVKNYHNYFQPLSNFF